MTIEKQSHSAHTNWYNIQYPTPEIQIATIKNWIAGIENNTINNWIHQRHFLCTAPFTEEKRTWITIGDGYGFDANFFYRKGLDVTATDIAGTFLPLAKSYDVIDNYSIENAECINFQDNSFDYVFCKESYHHFPRPYMAVYEMIRIAREAVILIEPNDPILRMPLLMALRNLLDAMDTRLLPKVWKNRYSFEKVGNYVFKLSEREMEKLAMGIGLPAVAFKGFNNNYYNPSTAQEKADSSSPAFRKIKRKLLLHNLLMKSTLLPAQVLCAVVFKKMPTTEVQELMKREGFTFYVFPPNPYRANY